MRNEGKTLVVAELDLFIGNPKDVTDDLGEGNPKKIYHDYFEFNFIGKMAQLSTFEEVAFTKVINRDDFSASVFDVAKKEKIYMSIPDDGQVAKTDSVYGDFVLFIEDYQVYRTDAVSQTQSFVSNANGMGGSWVGGGGSFPKLCHQFNFVLWDNNQKRVVSFGKVDSPTTFALE